MTRRPLIALLAVIIAVAMGVVAWSGTRQAPLQPADASREGPREPSRAEAGGREEPRPAATAAPKVASRPVAGEVPAHSSDTDLRRLARTPVEKEPSVEQESEAPPPGPAGPDAPAKSLAPIASAPAPAPVGVFTGLDFATWGSGWPPDTNGDIGSGHFIETVNTALGVFDRNTGARSMTPITFDNLTPNTSGTPCDSDNSGDPVVVWDSLASRWVVTDFAFTTNAQGALTSRSYECVLVSKTSNPVTGGWWYYAIPVSAASGESGWIADYPKVGVHPDGYFITFSMFNGAGQWVNTRVMALNRTDAMSGSNLRTITWNLPQTTPDPLAPGADTYNFSALPANARVETGLPPAGRPEALALTYGGSLKVWQATPNWTTPASSTLTGPTLVASGNPGFVGADAQSPGNALDTLEMRLMAQAQYTNINGVESLWLTHTVPGLSGGSGVRWYQVNVTGGTVASPPLQAATVSPDALWRFMPSLAVDKLGDMVLGYSVSGSALDPQMRYVGRLATDPASTLSQGEQIVVAGTGTQTLVRNGSPLTRWGDYSSMSLAPDGCTFWNANEVYTADGGDWQTPFATLRLPGCTSTGGAKPTPPLSPSASAPSGGTTSVTFSPPADSGFSAISAYTATCTSGDGGLARQGSAAQSPVSVVAVSAGHSYTCTVVATNSYGDSDPSAATNQISAPATVPGAPTIGSATTPVGQATSVSFSAPLDNGGSAILDYTATCTSTNGGTTRQATGAGSPLSVGSLSQGTTYTCTVTARNATGASAASGATGAIAVPAAIVPTPAPVPAPIAPAPTTSTDAGSPLVPDPGAGASTGAGTVVVPVGTALVSTGSRTSAAALAKAARRTVPKGATVQMVVARVPGLIITKAAVTARRAGRYRVKERVTTRAGKVSTVSIILVVRSP